MAKLKQYLAGNNLQFDGNFQFSFNITVFCQTKLDILEMIVCLGTPNTRAARVGFVFPFKTASTAFCKSCWLYLVCLA
jgi:hypothetical protein